MLSDRIKEQILEHAKAEFPKECCGLLIVVKGKHRYFACRNISEDPNTFILNPEDYSSAEELGEVVAVVHSHCNERATPSQADLAACEASNLPWVIVSIPNEEWEQFEPKGFQAPLIGRPYVYGVFDCYSVVRDWYKTQRGIELLDFERVPLWWERGGNWFLENFEKTGFYEVPIEDLKEGDLIFMQCSSPAVNHCAVYLGENKILQHCINRLSSRDVYGGYWRQNTRKVVRFKECVK